MAQESDSTQTRPKIGLVLSGGGAKGFAHIGVINVLEEIGITPDIITGTSMGSIIGGLYAVGYSGEELTEINQTANWGQLLNDNVSLNKVAMQEKRETRKYIVEFPFKEKKVDLPIGLIEGHNLEGRFSELFWPLSEEQNFDSLPIPFHCMAVDVVSGKVIEHRSGDLVTAIRSSMAIPTVFAPVKMDSMLLVDGGVARNFPVQEALDMGADIIIGVYVGFQENVAAEDLESMTAVLSRAVALSGIVDAREQFDKVDVLIIPKLGKYTSSDFVKGPEIEKLGEVAAREMYGELKSLADSLHLSLHPPTKIDQPHKILITGVEVKNLRNIDDDYIISKSGIEKGDSLSYADIKEAIEYMHGSPDLRKLTYSLERDEENEGYILVFNVTENPRAMVKYAARYDDDLGVGLISNITLRNVIVPSSRFLFTLNISENPELRMDLNKLVGKKQHFYDHFYYNGYRYELPLYNTGDQLGHYKINNLEFGYGIHYTPGLNHQVGVDGFYKRNSIKPQPDLQNIYDQAGFGKHRTRDWGYAVFYNVNTTDDLYFPKRGINFKILFTHAFSSKSVLENKLHGDDFDYFVKERQDPFASLLIDHNWYKSFGAVTYNFGISSGLNTDDPGVTGNFVLGGDSYRYRNNYRNFAGFNMAEIYTPNFVLAKSTLNIEVFKDIYLSGTVNVGNIGDSIEDLYNVIIDNAFPEYIWGYNAGIRYDSFIGPIQLLMAGNNQDSKTRFQISVGYPF
ncbi:patatin-like phospholipase family protein [Maribellus sediminis]|uniref:patatin-like phospholipase family protein n=1 Tax=Maribellus sediminis TaxID=2696285 RepID=UPI001430FCEE|nr:patatin-like phospholipase family protein [Maribellus sediminis]